MLTYSYITHSHSDTGMIKDYALNSTQMLNHTSCKILDEVVNGNQFLQNPLFLMLKLTI